VSFTVSGNENYTREQILTLSGLKIGQTVTKADFDAARDRLVESGAFLNVSYTFKPAEKGNGYSAELTVVEVSPLYAWRFEDLPISNDELTAFLRKKDPLFGPKIAGTKEAVEKYTRWVTEYMASKNYHEPITGKLTSDNPPELIVLFRPSIPRPSVAHVKFTGAAVIPISTLQNVMSDVGRGAVYSETLFRQLLDNNIRPLYEAKGYMRVAFPNITTEPDPSVKGIDVTVQVVEGPVYKLKAVHVQVPGGKEAELVKIADLRTNQPANFDDVKAARARLDDEMRRVGYMQVSTTATRQYDDNAKTVDVTFHVETGPQFTFAKLTIVGLDLETEPVIRKMWGLKEGKPFNVDYPSHFLNRVKEDGVFENLKTTHSENKVNPDDHTVEVTLYFNTKAQ